ncbi:MAG: cupin domain-containing protein [Rubrobacteraceae bacterium]
MTKDQTRYVSTKVPEAFSRRLDVQTSYWTMGMLVSWLAEGTNTGGSFALAEGILSKGTEPPPHTHTREDEAFYILEGEMSLRVGVQTIEAEPGDLVYLPRGIEHSFGLKTPTVRALFYITPAGIEEAFKQLSKPAGDLTPPPLPEKPPDVEGMVTIFESYGVKFALSPSPRPTTPS